MLIPTSVKSNIYKPIAYRKWLNEFLYGIYICVFSWIQYCRKSYCEPETQEDSSSAYINFESKAATFLVAVQQPCEVLHVKFLGYLLFQLLSLSGASSFAFGQKAS